VNRIERLATILTGLLLPAGAPATDVAVSGLFTNKAVVQIDGGPLQTLSVGQKTKQGVLLIAVDRESFARTVKPSARWLGEVARANALG